MNTTLPGSPPISGSISVDAPASDAAPAGPLELRLDAATPERPVALGSYLVSRRVGAGAMGVVYEARDRRGQRVALKTMRGKRLEWQQRLKNEFRSVADVTDPNLAALYELVAKDGDWYFTMEFVEGVDFLAYVTAATRSGAETIGSTLLEDAPPRILAGQERAAPPSHVLSSLERLDACLRQLARGVHALHGAGKLHRDLKPTNVLVEEAGRVVVLDFGLVDDGLSEPSGGRIEGTPAYMAPEQARGEPASPASDWYAVGVMLFQALTGQLPFRGSVREILLAKQREVPPLPSTLTPYVPPALDALCADLLRFDPAARPTGEEVLQHLGVDVSDGWHHADAGHGLLGRDAEIAVLLEAYAEVRAGSSIVQWVHGGSGMGKSALLKRLLAELRRSGAPLVLQGRCYACESVPYKAFDAIIDGLATCLGRLTQEERGPLLPPSAADLAIVFPLLRGALDSVGAASSDALGESDACDRNEVRVHAFRALKEILRRIAERRALVIAIDDLQWGDVDSARLLRELFAAPDAPRLLFIGLYRSDEAARSTFLQELSELWPGGAREGVRELAIELLSPADAKRLALDRLGPGGSVMAEKIAADAHGNPFLIEEFVRYARHRAGRASLPPESLSVEDAVLARVDQLPPKARRLLEVVAIAGRSLEQRVALAAAELGAEAMPVVRALETASLLRAGGLRDEDAVEVYHDRIRESVLGALPPAAIADHHRALGHALEAYGGAEPEVLARHFLAAGDHKRGAPYALRAAEHAASTLAFDRAAGLYKLVLEGYAGPEAEHRALKRRCADALVNAGRCAEAAPYFIACTRGALPDEAADLRRRAAEQLLVAGRVDEGALVLCHVLSELGIAYPGTGGRAFVGTLLGLARIGARGLRLREARPGGIPERDRRKLDACLTAARGLSAYDVARGAYFAVEALRLALRAGEAASAARSLAAVGSMVAYGGSAIGVRQGGLMIQEALDQARRLDDPALFAAAEVHLGISRMTAGLWAEAIAILDPALRFLRERCGGYGHERSYGEMTCILALESLGRLREVAWRADACLREAEATGNLYTRVQSYLYLALDRIVADDSRAAATLARDALALWPSERQTFLFQHWLGLKTSTYGDLYAGRPEAAFERIREAWPRVERSSLLELQFLRTFALKLRAGAALAVAPARPAEGKRLVDLAERDAGRLERERTTIARAAASLIRAGAAARRGRSDRALAHLGDAVAGYEASGMALYAAAARRQRGLLLAGDEGRGQVAAADAAMAGEGIAKPERWAAVYAPGFS